MQDERHTQLTKWLQKAVITQPVLAVTPLPADASFRRYFRVQLQGETLLAMDAPPEKEDSHSFVAIAKLFKDAGLNVPEIFAQDVKQGFLLITDFGDDLYYQKLTRANADTLYGNAIHDLIQIQQCACNNLPLFDSDLYLLELNNFLHWYLGVHLQLNLTANECSLFADVFERLITSALNQPQVCVHRDYHSRNLMLLPNKNVGIIDFQDAVKGAVTYDLVSLIRDCYIDWPQEKVTTWAKNYYQLAQVANIFPDVEFNTFMRWFDWMGMQRHLKAMFIFARKFHRDNDDFYLKDIPRALNYVNSVCQQYEEFFDLKKFFDARVLGEFQKLKVKA